MGNRPLLMAATGIMAAMQAVPASPEPRVPSQASLSAARAWAARLQDSTLAVARWAQLLGICTTLPQQTYAHHAAPVHDQALVNYITASSPHALHHSALARKRDVPARRHCQQHAQHQRLWLPQRHHLVQQPPAGTTEQSACVCVCARARARACWACLLLLTAWSSARRCGGGA